MPLQVVQLGGALGTMEFWGSAALDLLDAFAARLELAVPETPWITARDRVAEFATLLANSATRSRAVIEGSSPGTASSSGPRRGRPAGPAPRSPTSIVRPTELHHLQRHGSASAQARPRLQVVQLGGALGTMERRSGAPRRWTCWMPSRPDSSWPLPETPWITARDRVAEFATLLALVTGSEST